MPYLLRAHVRLWWHITKPPMVLFYAIPNGEMKTQISMVTCAVNFIQK